MITPDGLVVELTTLNAAGDVPSPKRRLPSPSVTGKIFSHSSSARSFFKSVWMKSPLPCTCRSGPSSCLSFRTASTASPDICVEFSHSSFIGFLEATYFRALFSESAVGSVCFGQKLANSSYVLRPSRRSKGLPICSPIASPTASSKYGTVQPPNWNPPDLSSSGPPGACMTPSSETKLNTTTFLIGTTPFSQSDRSILQTIGGAPTHRQPSQSVCLTKIRTRRPCKNRLRGYRFNASRAPPAALVHSGRLGNPSRVVPHHRRPVRLAEVDRRPVGDAATADRGSTYGRRAHRHPGLLRGWSRPGDDGHERLGQAGARLVAQSPGASRSHRRARRRTPPGQSAGRGG